MSSPPLCLSPSRGTPLTTIYYSDNICWLTYSLYLRDNTNHCPGRQCYRSTNNKKSRYFHPKDRFTLTLQDKWKVLTTYQPLRGTCLVDTVLDTGRDRRCKVGSFPNGLRELFACRRTFVLDVVRARSTLPSGLQSKQQQPGN